MTGTIVTHGLLLALLILGGLTFPVPPPEEEGILVNFGTDDTGFGLIEPEGDEANEGNPLPETTPSQPETTRESRPEPVETSPVAADNTQDLEETVVKEEPQPSAEELRREQEEAERIRREQEEVRQR